MGRQQAQARTDTRYPKSPFRRHPVIATAWQKDGLALTFDDVQLMPLLTNVHPKKPSLKTWFSRNILLNAHLVSSPMDRVTEDSMAIALALAGGIGCIHFNCSVEAQSNMVRAVKNFQAKFITNPACVSPHATINSVIKLQMEKRRQHFTKFFVLDELGRLLGITAKTDRKFSTRPSEDRVEDFMVRREDLVVAYRGIEADEAFETMRRSRKSILPVVESETDNTFVGAFFFKDLMKTRDTTQPLTVDGDGRLRVAAAVKADPDSLERAEALAAAGVDAFIIDTSHGHTDVAIKTGLALKKHRPDIDVISGNIATFEAARDLRKAGCFDGLRVGVGPGSICTTQEELGMGVPQVTAVYEACRGAQGEIPCIADGGLRKGGDINKALAVGASTCMIGNLFAGTDEAPCSEPYLLNGRLVCDYRGMGSEGAMESGGADRYHEDDDRPLTQGVEGVVPYRGSVATIITTIQKSTRHMMASSGAKTIPEFHRKAKLFRRTNSGVLEGKPHDVIVTKESTHSTIR